MKVEVNQVTSWNRVLNAARWTVNKKMLNKEPSKNFKAKMLIAEHSPIRLLEYDIKMYDIPNKVMGHLVRHHQGVEKFVGTHRSDRSNFRDENVNRTTPTNLLYSANAQAILNTSYKRLCGKAELDTRKVWYEVKNEISKIDPILAEKMVPQCVRLGFCPEENTCGFYKSPKYVEDRIKYLDTHKDE